MSISLSIYLSLYLSINLDMNREGLSEEDISVTSDNSMDRISPLEEFNTLYRFIYFHVFA